MASKGFAGKIHVLLIACMMVSFVLIMQHVLFPLYQAGIILLIVTILIQIPFGNISGDKGVKDTLLTFLRYFSILVVVFIAAILLAPYLVRLGGGV